MAFFRLSFLSKKRSYGGSITLAAIALLAASGFSLVGVALALQTQAPVPPAAAAGTLSVHHTQHNLSFGAQKNSSLALGFSRPVHLFIPAINVSSSLQALGKNPDGSIKVPAPPHFGEAAWYKHSPAPGELGASVIEGHVDSAKTGASVFFNLGKLRPGDYIFVSRADGKTAVFFVTAVRLYKKSHFPTKQFYTSNVDAELHLITCGGAFNFSSRHYESNTVVFSTLDGVTELH
jgi:hypothetical protein